MLFTIIAIVITIFGLIKDFKKDPGLNKKAKTYHFILLLILMLSYAGSFGTLGSVIRQFNSVNEYYSNDIGVIPGWLNLILYYVNLILSLTVLVFAYQMINRKNKARLMLIKLLPFLCLTSVFGFYHGWLGEGENIIINHSMILILGLIIMGGLAVVYIKIYSSKFMKDFFDFEDFVIPIDIEDDNN